MRVGIHNEPSGAGIGGSEYLVAMIGEALRERHDVEIIHHRANVDLGTWSAFSGTVLRGVRLRYVEPERPQPSNARSRWRIFQESAWEVELSRRYDLFITVTHGVPPRCHAAAGVLIVLFPLFRRSELWPWSEPIPLRPFQMRSRARKLYHEWKWRQRFDSYQTRLAISEFSRKWTREYWGLDCGVLYPAVETGFGERPKKNRVVSVGRFSLISPRKNHPLMIQTFGDLVEARQQGWRFRCLGGLSDLTTDQAYFASLQRMAPACGADVIGNLERELLVKEYEEAKVFWHAAGYGENERDHPLGAEHFGIVTVEAMAAGCVPVVINKGGQPEIVQHGVNGFLWDTPEQLAEYTRRLLSDDQLRVRMSAAARERAGFFGREQFIRRFQSLSPQQTLG